MQIKTRVVAQLPCVFCAYHSPIPSLIILDRLPFDIVPLKPLSNCVIAEASGGICLTRNSFSLALRKHT